MFNLLATLWQYRKSLLATRVLCTDQVIIYPQHSLLSKSILIANLLKTNVKIIGRNTHQSRIFFVKCKNVESACIDP